MNKATLVSLWRGLLLVWRALCYCAFCGAAWAFWTLQRLMDNQLCSRIDSGSVSCITPEIRRTAETAFTVILVGGFTFLPALMALFGIFYALRDLWRLYRGFRAKRISSN